MVRLTGYEWKKILMRPVTAGSLTVLAVFCAILLRAYCFAASGAEYADKLPTHASVRGNSLEQSADGLVCLWAAPLCIGIHGLFDRSSIFGHCIAILFAGPVACAASASGDTASGDGGRPDP